MRGLTTGLVVLGLVVLAAKTVPAHAASAGAQVPAPTVAQAPPPAVPSGQITPTTWAGDLLAALAAPASSENLRALVAWERAEGGHWSNTARFNPLNTTERAPGSYPINPVGVQAFTSWGEGLQATVATLRNGLYGGILAALRGGACAPCVADAVGASPWGTGRFAV